METKSKVYSILYNKCPHCHKGNFFNTNNAYDLRYFGVMNNRCSHCNEDFIREPGYYFGASYVSYSLTVGMGIGLYLLLEGVFKLETVSFLIAFGSLLIALLPVFYRISRLIWINFFVHYSEKAACKSIGEKFGQP
jgi:uncharacterized protein (DUF983 family)